MLFSLRVRQALATGAVLGPLLAAVLAANPGQPTRQSVIIQGTNSATVGVVGRSVRSPMNYGPQTNPSGEHHVQGIGGYLWSDGPTELVATRYAGADE